MVRSKVLIALALLSACSSEPAWVDKCMEQRFDGFLTIYTPQYNAATGTTIPHYQHIPQYTCVRTKRVCRRGWDNETQKYIDCQPEEWVDASK